MLSSISSYLPSMQSLPEISVSRKKALAITALVITTLGLASFPTADAGSITYGSCVLGCHAVSSITTGGGGVFFMAKCAKGCLVFLAPWCP